MKFFIYGNECVRMCEFVYKLIKKTILRKGCLISVFISKEFMKSLNCVFGVQV